MLGAAVHEKLTVWEPRGPGHDAVTLAGAPGRGVPEFVDENGLLSPPAPRVTIE